MSTRYGLADPEPTGRMGWIDGLCLVEFRLNTDDLLLWEACMFAPPKKDDVVPHAVGTAELADYTVTALRYEFREAVLPATEEDPEEEVPGALCFCTYIVTVKLGL